MSDFSLCRILLNISFTVFNIGHTVLSSKLEIYFVYFFRKVQRILQMLYCIISGVIIEAMNFVVCWAFLIDGKSFTYQIHFFLISRLFYSNSYMERL